MDVDPRRAATCVTERFPRFLLAAALAALCMPSAAQPQGSSAAGEKAIKVVGTDGSTRIVEIETIARDRLAAGSGSLRMDAVPLADGREESYDLERFEVFAPDAELVATDGKTTSAVSRPSARYYKGRGVGDPTESVFVAVGDGADGEMFLLSSHPKKGASIIAPKKDKLGRTTHRLARAEAKELEKFACHADSLLPNKQAVTSFVEPEPDEALKSTTLLDTEIIVDMTNHLFTTKFGSNQNAALNYVGQVFGASSAIFQRDLNVKLTVKQATVWTTADPFDSTSSDVQLTNYMNWNKANRAGTARDLAHLLGGRVSSGGIAFVGGMCTNTYGYGVSNIYGTYTLPTSSYTWDVNVVSHEIGHNFNSPHSHCYSPPIDCCYTGECACGTQAPVAGTLMSYCHMTNGTGGVGMYFHERCVTTMRAYAEGRTCLSAGVGATAPSAQSYGQTSLYIPNGDWTPSVSEGTRFGPVRFGSTQPRTNWFMVFNSGTAPLHLTGASPVTITGSNPGDFWVSQQPPSVVQPGAGAWFGVAFRPTALGTRSAMVYIPTNDPSNNLVSFWVDGNGSMNSQYWYTYAGAAAIPDNNASGLNAAVNVSDFPGMLYDVNVRFDGTACSSAVNAGQVGLSHSFVGDLAITLRSPAGTVVTLMNRNGGTGNNLCSVLFDDQGDGPSISSIAPSAAPWPGSYRAISPLSAFNGQNPNGTWTMNVRDLSGGDTGTLRGFTLLLTPRAEVANSFPNPSGWIPSGASNTNRAFTEADSANQSLKIWVKPNVAGERVLGWVAGNSWARLPYEVVGKDRYVRAKFHVYTGGQPDNHPSRIPNLRMRVSNRFAVSTVLEVSHHINADPEGTLYSSELKPSRDPARPSVYRVDFDPVDVPYLQANANTEEIMRMFEAYATEPQEEGYVALTESSLSVYPALPDSAPVVKLYAEDRNDFSGTVFRSYNISRANPQSAQTAGADLPRMSKAGWGIYLDTQLVPPGKIGIAAADIVPGAASEDYDPARRLRAEENRLYKIRFHATSTQASNRQAHIRFRARTAKFGWTQRLEIGGSWAIGTDWSSGNNAIAQQALPGVGSRNPDKHGTEDGGWYTLLFHSPMSRDIRADYNHAPLSTSMPNLSGQDGPGANTGRTRRDILLGFDLVDTLSPGSYHSLEVGQVTLDRIEIRSYDRGAD